MQRGSELPAGKVTHVGAIILARRREGDGAQHRHQTRGCLRRRFAVSITEEVTPTTPDERSAALDVFFEASYGCLESITFDSRGHTF